MSQFETTTKTIINTPHGKILKITSYEPECQPSVEYRIQPKCHICKKPMDCICYNFDNEDEPLQEAIDALKRNWICEKDECAVEYIKKDDPEYYKELNERYNGNIEAIAEVIQDSWDDETPWCYL